MSDGYSVDLNRFQDVLKNHIDTAVDHFHQGADELRPLQSIRTSDLLGNDMANLNGEFAKQSVGMQTLISQTHDALRDTLKALSDALWDVYHTYADTDQKHADQLNSLRHD